VTFPPEEQRLEIERLLLERPVDDLAGLTDLERAGMAKPVLFVEIEETVSRFAKQIELSAIGDEGSTEEKIPGTMRTVPLVRSWEPHESVDDLRAQQEGPIRKWQEELREGKRGVQ
jgi:hypothetical protein